MNCIICQDSAAEPLQDNTACPCRYKRHISCWIDYVHSKDGPPKCPMCRKDLTVRPIPNPSVRTPLRQSYAPYTPELQPILEETEHHNPNIRLENAISKGNKLLKIVCGMLVIAVALVVIIILI